METRQYERLEGIQGLEWLRENHFYTYVDWTLEDPPRSFYVGKGNKRRVREKERNCKWKNVAAKYGWRREVVFVSHYNEAVVELEIAKIVEHRTYCYDNLDKWGCNFTRGGEGMPGYRHTVASLNAIRDANSGRNHPLFGIHGSSHPNTGRHRLSVSRSITFDHKAKLSVANSKANGLDRDDALLICALYASHERTQKSIAEEFGVSQSTVSLIVNGKTWSEPERARGLKGDMNPRAKLNWELVRELRRRFENGERQANIAKQFNLNERCVWSIVHRKTWLDQAS